MEQRPLYEQRLWGHYHLIYENFLPDGTQVLCRQLHSIKATTRLRIIEVQMSDLRSEDDIERLPTVW